MMEFKKIVKIINSKKEKHRHAKGKGKLGYWKRNESHGCQMCYLNRKLCEIIDEIKDAFCEGEGN